MRAVGHRHPALHLRAVRLELGDERRKGEIEEDVFILGVIDDVDDLLGEEPRIDGVADRAHAGDGEIDLEMAEAVPGERADAIRLFDAEPDQRVGEPPGARMRVAIGVTVDRPFDRAGDDFGAAVEAVGEGDERRNEERLVLHQPVHGDLPISSRRFSERHGTRLASCSLTT